MTTDLSSISLEEIVKLANAAQRAPMTPPEGVEIMTIVHKLHGLIQNGAEQTTQEEEDDG